MLADRNKREIFSNSEIKLIFFNNNNLNETSNILVW